MRNLLRSAPEWMLAKGDEARHGQFAELGAFIDECRSGSIGGSSHGPGADGGHCIVAGDFNADVTFPGGKRGDMTPCAGEAMKVVLETMVKKVGLVDITEGMLVPTFGYMGKEQLLTNTGSRWTYKTDDLIFVDTRMHGPGGDHVSWRAVSMSVERARPPLPFTHLSDHWGVELVWSPPSASAREKAVPSRKPAARINATHSTSGPTSQQCLLVFAVGAVLAAFFSTFGAHAHARQPLASSSFPKRLTSTLLPGVLDRLTIFEIDAEADNFVSATELPLYNLDTKFCNIDRRHSDGVSVADFVGDYAGKRPVILKYGARREAEALAFGKRTLRDPLAEGLGNNTVILSASNSYTKVKVTKLLRDYIDENMSGEQTLASLGNETFYLFGDNYGDEWEPLMQNLRPNRYAGSENTLSFGLGAKGSGVPFHFHGGGFSEVFHGRKRWFLTPQGQAPPFDPDHSMLQWVHRQYPQLAAAELAPIQECTIGPGEMLYFPSGWSHGVLNLDPWTSFVSTFTMGEDLLRKPM
jgi:hypothetical protein